MKKEIEYWQFYHELGHAIIAYIFDGYLYHFKGVTFKPSDIKKANLHVDDMGYTIIHRIKNFNEFVNNNSHNAVLVDGLFILSGSAGASFFGRNTDFTMDYLLPSNFSKSINCVGADGDFEIIRKAETPFGLLIAKKQIEEKKLVFIYCKLYQILKDLFLKPEILNATEELFNTLKIRKELYVIDFDNVIDDSTLNYLKSELLSNISIDEFGAID